MKRSALNLAALVVVLSGARYLHAEEQPPVQACCTTWFGTTCCGDNYCAANLFSCGAK